MSRLESFSASLSISGATTNFIYLKPLLTWLYSPIIENARLPLFKQKGTTFEVTIHDEGAALALLDHTLYDGSPQWTKRFCFYVCWF